MTLDIRQDAARYYDLFGPPWDDVPFYRRRLPSPDADVLELGCGTGRVLVPLAASCRSIVGVDGSAAMLDRCRDKLAAAGATHATLVEGDITTLDLGRSFDLITAPFRVMQNLETDEQVAGLFRVIRAHLAPAGRAIINVFNPRYDRQTMLNDWVCQEATFVAQKQTPDGLVKEYDRRVRLQPDPLVIYPELIYRTFRGEEMVNETVLKIAMRCWYPHEFAAVIEQHGFRILHRWGGYDGETYGEGGELVIEFGHGEDASG